MLLVGAIGGGVAGRSGIGNADARKDVAYVNPRFYFMQHIFDSCKVELGEGRR